MTCTPPPRRPVPRPDVGSGAASAWTASGQRSARSADDPSRVDTVAAASGEAGPGPGRSRPVEEDVARGATLGRYLVLARVGAGGMGVVFAAYDPDLDRRVALKVLRASVRRARGASEGRARLLREAQAMARVQHENVIAVHDVGTIGDRVFIAMEFIEGDTVGAWIKQVRPSAAAVCEVFIRAGRGLAAAHAQGLIHRDFKPDNVLRGHDGRVCVVDFGLARRAGPRPTGIDVTSPADPTATEPQNDSAAPHDSGRQASRTQSPGVASDLTRTGALVGTPAYMAPEQHLGAPATERSDQFSFCVSLYEALYGERPFAGCNHTQLIVNLTEGNLQPVPADAKVPPWLRRVLLRGLSIDPARRFASMDALLAALAPRHGGRRRAWMLASAGAAVLASVTLGQAWTADDPTLVCGHGDEHLRGVWGQPERQRFSAAFMAVQRPFARDAWMGVSDALDDYTRRWVAARIGACEATHVRGEQSAALLDARMACLDRRLDGVRAVTALFDDADAAVVERALDAVQGLPPPEDCSDRQRLLADVARPQDQATLQAIASQRRALYEARVLIEAHRLEPALLRLARALLAVRDLNDPALEGELLLARADAQEAAGDLTDARASVREALLTAEAAGDDRTAARAWIGLLWLEGYREARIAAGHDAADHARALLQRIGGDPELLALLVARQADVAYLEGKYEDSLAQHREGLRLREAVDGPDHPRTADSHTGIGHALTEMQRYPEALAHYEQALSILEANYGPRHPNLAHALTNVGVTQEYLGDLLAARQSHERALAVAEQAYGPAHSTVADVLNNYAAVLHQQGELSGARVAYERALLIWKTTYGTEHPDVGMALHNLAIVAQDEADWPRAVALYSEALALRQRAQGPGHPDVVQSRQALNALVGGESDVRLP